MQTLPRSLNCNVTIHLWDDGRKTLAKNIKLGFWQYTYSPYKINIQKEKNMKVLMRDCKFLLVFNFY